MLIECVSSGFKDKNHPKTTGVDPEKGRDCWMKVGCCEKQKNERYPSEQPVKYASIFHSPAVSSSSRGSWTPSWPSCRPPGGQWDTTSNQSFLSLKGIVAWDLKQLYVLAVSSCLSLQPGSDLRLLTVNLCLLAEKKRQEMFRRWERTDARHFIRAHHLQNKHFFNQNPQRPWKQNKFLGWKSK